MNKYRFGHRSVHSAIAPVTCKAKFQPADSIRWWLWLPLHELELQPISPGQNPTLLSDLSVSQKYCCVSNLDESLPTHALLPLQLQSEAHKAAFPCQTSPLFQASH